MKEAHLPDGGRLAYTLDGEGPPLLLLRPLGGSILSWGRFADRLAESTRVVAFDFRGTGASSDAPWGTTTRSMARDALWLLDHLGIEETYVYGISLGGMVASWLAIDAPERVGALVLASTLPEGTMVRRGAWRRGLSIARCLMKPAPLAEACMATRILSHHFRRTHPADVRRIQEAASARPASRRGILTLLLAAAAHDVRSRLHEITADVRVLVGEYDPLLTLASQKDLLRDLKRATFEVISGAGHDLSVEAPEETAACVLAAIGL